MTHSRAWGVLFIASLASAGCDAFGRPQIVDECGRVQQESRFLKCVEVVPAKEPCAPGVTKLAVTTNACR